MHSSSQQIFSTLIVKMKSVFLAVPAILHNICVIVRTGCQAWGAALTDSGLRPSWRCGERAVDDSAYCTGLDKDQLSILKYVFIIFILQYYTKVLSQPLFLYTVLRKWEMGSSKLCNHK